MPTSNPIKISVVWNKLKLNNNNCIHIPSSKHETYLKKYWKGGIWIAEKNKLLRIFCWDQSFAQYLSNVDHLLYSVTCQVIQGEALGELYCIFYYLLKHEMKFNMKQKTRNHPKSQLLCNNISANNVLKKPQSFQLNLNDTKYCCK